MDLCESGIAVVTTLCGVDLVPTSHGVADSCPRAATHHCARESHGPGHMTPSCRLSFVQWHLALGVERLYLYFDDNERETPIGWTELEA